MGTVCIYLCVFTCRHTIPLLLIESILIIIKKCLGGKVLQSTTFLWPFGKKLVDKFNPNSFFPTPKICHIKFDPVFDPSKGIMLGIEGIKYCRIIPGS